MDLRQLTTFLQVAELGSLGKASDRLRIAQPALSRQMRLLEGELRVALFVRHGRGMELTPAGERLRARAVGILRQVEEARSDVMDAAGAVRGQVAFGLPPTVGGILATRLIERVLAAHPEITLRVVQAFSGYLIEWLQRGEIDIAVVYAGPPATGVRQTPLLNETLHFVAAPQPGLSPHHAVAFTEVAAERLVLPGPQHGLRKLVDDVALQRGLSLSIAVEADDLQVLKDLSMRRLGATILPLAAVRQEVEQGRLAAAPIVDPALSRRLVVAEALGRQMSNAARAFARELRAEVTDMVQAGIWTGQLLRER